MKRVLLISVNLFLISFTGLSQVNKFSNPPIIQDENYAIEIMDVRAEKTVCTFKVRITNNTSTKSIDVNPYMIGGFMEEENIFYPSTKKTLKTLSRKSSWVIESGKSSSKFIELPTGEFLNAENFSIIIKQISLINNDGESENNLISISPIELESPDKKAKNEKKRLKEEKKQIKLAKKTNIVEIKKLNNKTEKEESNFMSQENAALENNVDSILAYNNTNTTKFKITYNNEGVCNWNIQIIQNDKVVCIGTTDSNGEFEGEFSGYIGVPVTIKGNRDKKEFNFLDFYYVNESTHANHFEVSDYIKSLTMSSVKEVSESATVYSQNKENRENMNIVMDAQNDFLDEAQSGSNDARMKKDLAMTKVAFKGAHTATKVAMASEYLGNNKAKKEIIKLKTMRLTTCK